MMMSVQFSLCVYHPHALHLPIIYVPMAYASTRYFHN